MTSTQRAATFRMTEDQLYWIKAETIERRQSMQQMIVGALRRQGMPPATGMLRVARPVTDPALWRAAHSIRAARVGAELLSEDDVFAIRAPLVEDDVDRAARMLRWLHYLTQH